MTGLPRPVIDEKLNDTPEVATLIKRFEEYYGCTAFKGLPEFGEAHYYDPSFVQLCLKKLVKLIQKDKFYKRGFDRLSITVEKVRGYPLIDKYEEN